MDTTIKKLNISKEQMINVLNEILLRGNHDFKIGVNTWKKIGFSEVYKKKIIIDNLVLTHAPTEEVGENQINIFGHIHDKPLDERFDKDITFGEYFLFNLKCMKNTNSIYIINKAYYNYMRRLNEETLKMKFLRNKIHLRRLFYKKWIEFYKAYDIYENVSKELQIYEGFKIYTAIISVANKNCSLKYKEKVEYINEFITFENSDCLFKYMENKKELKKQLECLKNGEIEKFYDIINKKLNI